MGEHGHSAIRKDHAIESFYRARENYHNTFRWTYRSALLGILLIGVIPGLGVYAAYRVEGKVNLQAKRRGEPIFTEK